MRVFWRHHIRISNRRTLTIQIRNDESTVVVRVVGSHPMSTTEPPHRFDHTDLTRIIPADLADHRIVLDELRIILGDALHGQSVDDAEFRRIMRDVQENYPR